MAERKALLRTQNAHVLQPGQATNCFRCFRAKADFVASHAITTGIRMPLRLEVIQLQVRRSGRRSPDHARVKAIRYALEVRVPLYPDR